jgi:hypothetical protein
MNLGKKEYLKVPFTNQGHPSKDCGSFRPFHRSRRIRIRFDSHSSVRCRCEQLPDGHGAAGRYSTVALPSYCGLPSDHPPPPPSFLLVCRIQMASVHRRPATPRPQSCSLLLLSLHVLSFCCEAEPLREACCTLIKKKIKFFLIVKEIQDGAVAKSYKTNGRLIYGEIFAHFLIYILGSPSSYMTLQLLHSEFPYI